MKHSCKAIIAPSLLSCDLSRIADDAQQMLDMGADWLHMDIMDGHFVPNISFGPPVIESLHKSIPNAIIDCHLMVSEPEKWIQPLYKAGATSITFHFESILPNNDPLVLINIIKSYNMKVGMTIKPQTNIDVLFPYIQYLDLVLIMTVEPGFSGQSFMSNMMNKVTTVRTMYPTLNIQVDGGLSPTTINIAAQAGANNIVAASAIFNFKNTYDRQSVINTLRAGVEKYIE